MDKYQIKNGYRLRKLMAWFNQPQQFQGSKIHINAQYRFCLTQSLEQAVALIHDDYASQGVQCKLIEEVRPTTTINSDLARLSDPEKNVLGFLVGANVINR
ncbi:hypothetical protein LRP52_23985 [Photobacterium sp. ZSDE20]|uniref:Uncharacterized protein n=1 Tax=Photobacterium pectinilyticum TaxID=2906793 RepID=A0ABT1N1H1_9GAMM|nr:hypothetical protein [Photobacterium sp. ZSDE20]MCQ1058382.1 hypothetical protein [Photobacterium sp. ZSDE20]MDD1825255.1 hypothetical protein [Photobacterium sp. ZSDE20]